MTVHGQVAEDAAGVVPAQREALDVPSSTAQQDALEHYGWEAPHKPSTKPRPRVQPSSMVRPGESLRTPERDG
jgi:hypothetical protein